MVALALAPFSVASVVRASESPEQRAVREVIGEYVAGWRAGDVERLSRVFELEHGHVLWRQDDGDASTLRSLPFGELLKKRRPNPGYGEPYEILSLEIHGGELATATFRVERAPRGSYINHLTLHRVRGEWRVTSKSFVWQPAEAAASKLEGAEEGAE